MEHAKLWPLRAIRQYCLDCSGTSKMVTWCTCDGIHSTRCPLWPFRFGIRPETAKKRYGQRLLTPEDMPDANVCVEDLQQGDFENVAAASVRMPGETPGLCQA